MSIHLIEPYNAYQKKPLKKKHPTEIAEEESLFIRTMIQEQARQAEIQRQLMAEAVREHLALREAAAQKNLLNQNLALPQYTPQPASQQIQDGQYATPAGGGGIKVVEIPENEEVANFLAVPSSGYEPLTVTFQNYTPTPANDTFLWQFGSGSLTSTDATPTPVTYTREGTYTVTLQATSSAGAMTTATQTITLGHPQLTASFSLTSGSNIAGVAFHQFTDTSTYNAYPQGNVTGRWYLGDQDDTSYEYTYLSGGFANVYGTGSYTASLALTESLVGLTSRFERSFSLVAPTLTVDFTFISSSNSGPGFEDYEPMTASLTSNVTYNGGGLVWYNWFIESEGAIVSSSMGFSTTYDKIFNVGYYTASLQVTESTFNITSVKTQNFRVQT
jgi:hypothetical protein